MKKSLMQKVFRAQTLKDWFEDTNKQEYSQAEYDALTDREKQDSWPAWVNKIRDQIHGTTPEERERIDFLNAEHRRRNQ